MKRMNMVGALFFSCAVLLACNRDHTNDSMAPEGMSASPRPVGINDPTAQRNVAQLGNTDPAASPSGTPTPPAGITSGTTMGGSGGGATHASGGLGGNKQR